jgi:hypothetical protein
MLIRSNFVLLVSHMAAQFDTDNGVKTSQSPLRGLRTEKVLSTDGAEIYVRSFS